MRVNVYAEEMTSRAEIVEKTTADGTFTGLRFYLELPVTKYVIARTGDEPPHSEAIQVRGPFMHHPGDDDSAAVTFWGKRDLLGVLKYAVAKLESYYNEKDWDATEPRRKPAEGHEGTITVENRPNPISPAP